MNIVNYLFHSWHILSNRDPTRNYGSGGQYSYRPEHLARYSYVGDKSIITSIINHIAIDAASIDIKHVQLGDDGEYKEDINSGLNSCLNLSANIDQTGRAFLLDAYISLLDEGVVALVPTETNLDPEVTQSTDILSIRVCKILEWYPSDIRIELYDDRDGITKETVVPKTFAAIVENPFYSIMNEPNSTLQRLKHKLSILDITDNEITSGKLNLIVSLPYQTNSTILKNRAEASVKNLDEQLSKSTHGIAYIDGSEKITQLNRSIENNLLDQIQYLTDTLYSQLGLTPEILNNTASSEVMENYYNRVVEPIVAAVVDSMKRTFITKNARTRKHDIQYFRDPFRLVPATAIADLSDKMTRNEIMSSNELRAKIGLKPSTDPGANELRNKNLSQSKEEIETKANQTTETEIDGKEETESQNGNNSNEE